MTSISHHGPDTDLRRDFGRGPVSFEAIPDGLEGLPAAEAQRRLHEIGPNRWVPTERWARLRQAVTLLLDPMAVMLMAAAAAYLILGEERDAIVLALALIPVLGVDVLLEARSRAALESLARAAEPLADVVRDGRVRSVAIEEVVPGDVLLLREGQTIAADGVVRWAANLSIDESSLTGESAPQVKRDWPADLPEAPTDGQFFAGSLVLTGHGFGQVRATGPSTRYGATAALVAGTSPPASPLQRRTGVLVRRLGVAAVGAAIALAALSLWRGEPWTRAVLGAVSLAMAAIPEEFPLVLTLFLSVGAWRLAAHGMLVRRLASVETLGSTTVICTDKTGTLTHGRFEVVSHAVVDSTSSDDAFLLIAVLACEQHPTDAMERAIVAYAGTHAPAVLRETRRWTLIRDYDFDPVGKHMSHVWTRSGAGTSVAAKGALEGILAHCAIGADERRAVLQMHEAMASRGLRVLAVASKTCPEPGTDRDADERDLQLHGLLGFADPLRPEVPGAVDECQRAGIRIKMITGDHALTAHAVAEAAGILHDDGAIVVGDDLTGLSDAARASLVVRAAIFARITPEQKFAIVATLQSAGHIVAMTGDGVNDAAALRRADIGIAMGRRGTDVARATADLVLLDDNFASIVSTIRQGRHILQNIQRAFLYLLAFHIPIIGLAVLAPLSGVPLLLLPIHLVWLELIVHPVSALVFQADAASPEVMARPPRAVTAPLLPPAALARSAVSGAMLTLVAFAIYWWQLSAGGEHQARAACLVTLTAGYQTLMFAERVALPELAIDLVPRTRTFWVVWWTVGVSLIAMLLVPPLARLFRVSLPPLADLVTAAALGAASVAWRFFRLGKWPLGRDDDARRPEDNG